MDRKSWNDAKQRLSEADRYLDKIDASLMANWGDRVKTWEGFLTELNRTFNKLAHGERKGEPSFAILTRIKRDREEDPLLSYLREARNCLDHGIGLVATDQVTVRPAKAEEFIEASFTILGRDGNTQVIQSDPHDQMMVDRQWFALQPVVRKTMIVPVPTEHFGAAIPEISPLLAGRLAVAYAAAAIDELEALLSD